MKFLSVVVCIYISTLGITAHAQDADSLHRAIDSFSKAAGEQALIMDSLMQQHDAYMRRQAAKHDSINIAAGIDYYMQEKKKRDEQQMRSIYIRSTCLAGMACLSAIQYMRRRKAKRGEKI